MVSEGPERIETVDSGTIDPERILGSAVTRREDPALLTGEAEFTDDIQRPGMAHLSILSSRYAHARIESVDTSRAEEQDGVLAVYTAEDLAADDVPGTIPVKWQLPTLKTPDRKILSSEKVRYSGDRIAVVVAEDRYVARKARDLIDVEYESLSVVTDTKAAVDADAPLVHESLEDNVAFDWELGDPDAVSEVFDAAPHVVTLDLTNQRLVPNAIEPRAAVATFDQTNDHLTVQMTTQNAHIHRQALSESLGVPEHKLRVVAPAVGGGFGSKTYHYPDEALTAWCAMQLERPVKWQATRMESFSTDSHGRGHDTHSELAVDDDGTILGARVRTYANVGAYLSLLAPAIPTIGYGTIVPGQYDIPIIHCRVTGTVTNTTPVDAYRGAGRSEGIYVIERLMDVAARELDIDPVDLRRRNFVPSDAFPHETATGLVYDSGDYEKTLDAALDHVDYEALRRRQAELRDQGRYLGIGFGCYVESAGYAPSKIAGQLGSQTGYFESSVVRFHPSGTVTVYCGTADQGQGHETVYAQIVANELGVSYEDIEVVEGDTAEIPEGTGTFASRSATVGGGSIAESSRKVIDKAKSIAAHQLEASKQDLVFEDGEFHVTGAPERSITIQNIASEAYLGHDLPEGMEPGLEATTFFDPVNLTFPFGTHVAVVEIDPATGDVEFETFLAVDDCGQQLNPKIVEGQIHGGIAQGIGQALYEEAEYDQNGNLITGSLQNYVVPRAAHVPTLTVDHTTTPSPHNPLGVKGVGESPTIGSTPAVVNAVVDALQPFGVEHVDMPLDPETVWSVIQEATGGEQ